MGSKRDADSRLEIIEKFSKTDIINPAFLKKINYILEIEWFELLDKPESLLQTQKECLNFYENVIKKLINLPRPNPYTV
jgi:hypothetical protein